MNAIIRKLFIPVSFAWVLVAGVADAAEGDVEKLKRELSAYNKALDELIKSEELDMDGTAYRKKLARDAEFKANIAHQVAFRGNLIKKGRKTLENLLTVMAEMEKLTNKASRAYRANPTARNKVIASQAVEQQKNLHAAYKAKIDDINKWVKWNLKVTNSNANPPVLQVPPLKLPKITGKPTSPPYIHGTRKKEAEPLGQRGSIVAAVNTAETQYKIDVRKHRSQVQRYLNAKKKYERQLKAYNANPDPQTKRRLQSAKKQLLEEKNRLTKEKQQLIERREGLRAQARQVARSTQQSQIRMATRPQGIKPQAPKVEKPKPEAPHHGH